MSPRLPVPPPPHYPSRRSRSCGRWRGRSPAMCSGALHQACRASFRHRDPPPACGGAAGRRMLQRRGRWLAAVPSAKLLAGNGAAIHSLIIDGRFVLSNGRLLTVDEIAPSPAGRGPLPLQTFLTSSDISATRRSHAIARTVALGAGQQVRSAMERGCCAGNRRAAARDFPGSAIEDWGNGGHWAADKWQGHTAQPRKRVRRGRRNGRGKARVWTC